MATTEAVTIRIAEAPCGASSAFLHPACAHGLTGVEFHDLTVGELARQEIVTCDGCGERILPKGVDTPEGLRRRAADCRQRSAESWERSDTDGCVTQWCSDLSARLYERQAEILEAGGLAEFPALFDVVTGARVKAKLVHVPNRFRGYGTVSKWLVLDAAGNAIEWVTAFPAREATMARKGYREGREMAPAAAKIGGSGKGLSGLATAHVVVYRTDAGYPADAVVKAVR